MKTINGFEDANKNWVEVQDGGDGNTFVARDIVFFSDFAKDFGKENANVFEGSDVQIALNKWFYENAPEDIKENFDIDLLTMTEIFGETQASGEEKFWPDEPYTQLPLFKDWRNRTKGEINGEGPEYWWTKSSYLHDAFNMCLVLPDGSADYDTIGSKNGVVPCFRRKTKQE